MNYPTLAACVADLERHGHLVRIDSFEVDPDLELAAIQRRACRKGAPALFFSRVKGTPFPMLTGLFGTTERTRFIFRSALAGVGALLAAKADPFSLLKHPARAARLPPTLWNMLPRTVKTGPAVRGRTRLSLLPRLVSHPLDGGAYITLPQVYTENPDRPGPMHSNLGMYRVQLSGNAYEPEREVGLHYQIHRGIGPHHMAALRRGEELPVNVFVGGPPALTLAAIMPLPEGVPELCFAGALGGRRIPLIKRGNALPIPAEVDFCLCGKLVNAGSSAPATALTKPEGPFGDHLGYYSLTHDFPVMRVEAVYHRPDAIWPFTSVGRPPQEDSVLGAFVHELVSNLVPTVFSGIREVHAVDAAGVHPLLLAVGYERYVPFAPERIPQELLASGLALLGSTQTSLSKYVLLAAHEDVPALSAHDVPAFFAHVLERTDFARDLHFVTRTTMDTLDYSGISLNQGSKLLWTVAGEPKRRLCREMPRDFSLPKGFADARLFAPGILVLRGPRHARARDEQDSVLESLAERLGAKLALDTAGAAERPALVVVADDAEFTAASWENFLWVTFTRSDPATDLYGPRAEFHCKHWRCEAPLIIDARLKAHHAPPLEPDPDVERRVDELAAPGGVLHGLVD